MAKFTVDTHLFRELGALLVGRDSTALVELIKNSYDADASSVVVYGEQLADFEHGYIRVSDDGTGMTPEEFENGFLRIASRSREQGNRTSKRYGRRFTGAKGIGRLAAHKLGHIVDIQSVSQIGDSKRSVEARIDWDAIERHQTIDELDDAALTSVVVDVPKSSKPGTIITIRKLRSRWSKAQLGEFLGEVQTFEPPGVLTSPLKKSNVVETLLFDDPSVRQTSSIDPGFSVDVEGEFAAGQDYWQTLLDVANWVIEITAISGVKTVRCVIAPTARTLVEFPLARKQSFKFDHPSPAIGPFFQARILIREGQLRGSIAEKAWSRRAAGIRIYMEGFRVLPYGEPKDDWLSLDADYARRSRSPFWGDDDQDDEKPQDKPEDKDAALVFLPNRQYFGAVFLTQTGAPALRMLVNREGFVPDDSFKVLVATVRRCVDLATRVRASSTSEARMKRREKRADRKRSAGDSAQSLKVSVERASTLAQEARRSASEGNLERASQLLFESVTEFEGAARDSQELISEMPMIRVLASVGTQMASFIHEIRGLLGMAESLDAIMSRLRSDPAFPKPLKSQIAKIHASISDLRRNLERQASYLVDVVTPDARRRRSKYGLHDRFEASRRLVEHLAERRSISIRNQINSELKSPAMFQAELTTIFANLLSNAVKAAGAGGRIVAQGSRLRDGKVRVVIENTGAKVEPEDAEKWFKPFESTTTDVDPVLGQGMGLGLPITRNMLDEYGAQIKFIPPSRGFAAAIELVFPE